MLCGRAARSEVKYSLPASIGDRLWGRHALQRVEDAMRLGDVVPRTMDLAVDVADAERVEYLPHEPIATKA